MTIAAGPAVRKPSKKRGILRDGSTGNFDIITVRVNGKKIDITPTDWSEMLRSRPSLAQMMHADKPLLRHRRQSLMGRIFSAIHSFFN